MSRLGSLLLLLMLRVTLTVSVRDSYGYFHASLPWIRSSRRPTRGIRRAAFSMERQLHCRGGESTEAPLDLASESASALESLNASATTATATGYNVSSNVRSDVNVSSTLQLTEQTKENVPAWKRELPLPLCEKGPKTLQKLVIGSVEIYLLGTAHVSNDSSADVKLLLDSINPDAIFVELCEARIPLLEGQDPESTSTSTQSTVTNTNTSSTNIGFWDRIKAVQQEQGGSVVQALSSVLLTSVQEDYASELGVELGGEFRAAYRYWQQRQDTPNLILGDRPLHLTLIRAWESLWWWPKAKVMAGLLWSSWQKPDKDELIKWLEAVRREESDVLTESLNELRKHFPTLHTCIIEERDAWLSAKLVQTCKALASRPSLPAGGKKQVVVAIVGAGHVPGISEWLTKTNATESPEQVLSRLVSTRRFAKDAASGQLLTSWIKEVTELQGAPHSS
jgi:pheromone shutdown protein TraB